MKPIPAAAIVAVGILATAAWVGSHQTEPTQSPNAAPGLTGSQWFNAPEGEKSVRVEKGSVTLVHFWTFACSNCQANLPAYDRVFSKYNGAGLRIIGVHTPELAFEKDVKNVEKAIGRLNIRWPVLIDEDNSNWQRWKLEYWPTVFLVDRKGVVRFKWEGELNYDGKHGEAELRKQIDRLLAERS